MKTFRSCYRVEKVIVSTNHFTYEIKNLFVYTKKLRACQIYENRLMTASTEL